ncbi:hypothetical protein BSL82_05610 [Tardibacter chloracetimidivorans]|uniref:Uncharacterized protein n=1 Tax=Tardibacter chloracetimidivorans TaxID=1921510 RepID=A0A1L3ZTD2_9SPHN|nr:hypothetical protein [Tardibacter chloracetimidivorans]API58849.1 hypothetical protein BSL82_05610 [Tardibacter chloracetimidivorans]
MTTINLFAYTAPGADYPGYVSINRNAAGDVEVTVRSAPTEVDGIRICGQTCRPGGDFCNNYCNLAPEKGPMADRALPHTFVREGITSSFTIPAAEWAAFADGPKAR